MFVPNTPNGELAKRLQLIEDKYSQLSGKGKLRMVERTGVTVLDSLANNNPYEEETCGREECVVCIANDEEVDETIEVEKV